MAAFRYIAIWILYGIGHWLSLLVDALAADWPRCPECLLDWAYRASNCLLLWSSDLDTDEIVWLRRRDGETDESFTARCRDRFGDDYITD